MSFSHYFLSGGAGFLGSHFVDALLAQDHIKQVTIYDNFSSGREWHYRHHLNDPRLIIIKANIQDAASLQQAMKGHDVVIHLASNPDIARAAREPSIDFDEGTLLTHMILEAARITHIKRIIYTSGSGVYGDVGYEECREDRGNMYPVSTYGASKLAGEALISSYCHMFGLTACIFRFGNIVGARQTHGVAFDFINNLILNSSSLKILGDGSQSKSYIYAQDVVSAVLLANTQQTKICDTYNVATGDYITVTEIADLVVHAMHLTGQVEYQFAGGDRGWKGDVPIVRLNTDKIKTLGWQCKRNCAQAITASIQEMLKIIKNDISVEQA